MYQVGASCYSTKVAALQATASAQIGAVVPHAGGSSVVSVGSITDSGIEYVLTSLSTGASVVQLVSLDPQPCGLLTSDDVGPLAWAVVGGWISIYLIKLIWRRTTE